MIVYALCGCHTRYRKGKQQTQCYGTIIFQTVTAWVATHAVYSFTCILRLQRNYYLLVQDNSGFPENCLLSGSTVPGIYVREWSLSLFPLPGTTAYQSTRRVNTISSTTTIR